MKTISSLGGPFIGLNRKDVPRWSGVFGKRVIGSESPLNSDYEAACTLTGRRNLAFDDEGRFLELSSHALIIAPPVETAIIVNDDDMIVIAQVEAAEEEWSFSHITRQIIDEANYTENRTLSICGTSADYILFDSSNDGRTIDDSLTFTLRIGSYMASSAMYNQDDVAHLNLFRFLPVP